jgi:MoxR-like ATPase
MSSNPNRKQAVKDLLSQGQVQSKAASKKNAKKKVEQLLGALDEHPDIEPDADTIKTRKVSRKALAPITRPNGQEYYPRVIHGRTDIETLQVCREAQMFVLLEGFPGTGKTALIEAAFGDEAITVNGHGDLEATELVGNYVPNPDNPLQYDWIDGPLVTAMRNGQVLFIDDTTMIPPPVLAKLYGAMDGRGTITVDTHGNEVIKAAPGFFVVGAHNPGAPGAMLSEALSSRFQLQIRVGTDLKMAGNLGVPRKAITLAANLRTQRDKGEVTWAPEMRELLTFSRIQKNLGLPVAIGNLISAAPEIDREAVQLACKKVFKDYEDHCEVLQIADSDTVR